MLLESRKSARPLRGRSPAVNVDLDGVSTAVRSAPAALMTHGATRPLIIYFYLPRVSECGTSGGPAHGETTSRGNSGGGISRDYRTCEVR